MNRYDLDAIVCISPENVRYFSDFWALEPYNTLIVLIMTRNLESILLTPIPEMGGILSTDSWIKNRRYYGKYHIEGIEYDVVNEDPVEAIKTILQDLNIANGKIGIEENFLPHKTYVKLDKVLSDAKLLDVNKELLEIRMIKTKDEIKRIKDIVKISEKSYLKALATAGEGVSELEVAKALKTSLIQQDASWTFIEMGAGTRGGLVNSKPTNYRMKKGEVLRLDLGTISKGYCSDISRNATVGPATNKQKKIHNTLLAGHQCMMEEIRPGVKFSEIFKIGLNTVKKTFPNYWRSHLGHGLGVGTHELPNIKLNEKGYFKPGMVFTIELPYYLAKDGGYNIEDALVITEDGFESISEIDRSIYVL
jgi:Xaa-Pro aminopeptidase